MFYCGKSQVSVKIYMFAFFLSLQYSHCLARGNLSYCLQKKCISCLLFQCTLPHISGRKERMLFPGKGQIYLFFFLALSMSQQCYFIFCAIADVLASQGCHSKLPQTEWLKITEIYCATMPSQFLAVAGNPWHLLISLGLQMHLSHLCLRCHMVFSLCMCVLCSKSSILRIPVIGLGSTPI